MKILFLTSVSPFDEVTGPGAGGAERAMRVIAEDMAKLGHDVHFLSLSDIRSPKHPVQKILLHLVPKKKALGSSFPGNLIVSSLLLTYRIFFAWGPDKYFSFITLPMRSIRERARRKWWNFNQIVEKICLEHQIEHIHCYSSLPDSLAVAIASQKTGVSFSIRMGGRFWFSKVQTFSNNFRRSSYIRDLRLIFHSVHGLTYNSKFIFEESYRSFKSLNITPTAKEEILDIGLDLSLPPQADFNSALSHLPDLKHKRVLICVGTFKGGSKRQDLILKALSQLHHLPLHIVFVGGGPLLQEHIALAKSLNTENTCTFLGAVSRDLVFDLLRNSHGFLLPTEFEGASKALAEAMVLGKFIIASNIPANAEYIQDQKNGLLVTNSVEAFKSALEWFIENPEKCRLLGLEAQKTAQAIFSPEKNAKRYETFFKTLLALK